MMQQGKSKLLRFADPALLIAALALLVHGANVWWPIEADDAYISFRYAQNLAEGIGPVFNLGERVEGYSNPLWVLLMAGVMKLGIDPVPASKALGVAAAAALIVLLYRGVRRMGIGGWGAGVAALLVGSCLEVQVWSVGGLETLLYSLLLFGGVLRLARTEIESRDALVASLLLALASLTRPEGVAFWGAGLLIATLRSRRSLLPYLVPGLLIGVHIAWRYSYYGELVPNTYFVKVGEGGGFQMWLSSFRELSAFISQPGHLAWCALAALGAFVGMRMAGQLRSVAIVGGAALCHFAYVMSVGGDGLGFGRFYIPLLAPLAFLVALLHHDAVSGQTRRVALRTLSTGVAVLIAAQNLHTLSRDDLPGLTFDAQGYKQGKEKLGRHLAATRPPDTLVAVVAAGAIPFYSRLPTIDMYGLNDRHIARTPFAPGPWLPGHMKWDNEYVLRRRPDLIAINKGYFRKGDLTGLEIAQNPRMLALTAMDRDLFERAFADPDYHLTSIDFEDGSRYFVFERRSSAEGARQ
jgi:arabinofuranosyltransferase